MPPRSRSSKRYRAVALIQPSLTGLVVPHVPPAHLKKVQRGVSVAASSAMISTVFFLPPAARKTIMATHHALQYALGSGVTATEREQLALTIKTLLAYVVTYKAKHVLGTGMPARLFSLTMMVLHFSRVAGELLEVSLFRSDSAMGREAVHVCRLLAGSFGLLLQLIADHTAVISERIVQTTKLPDMYKRLTDAWNTKRSLGAFHDAFARLECGLQREIETRARKVTPERMQQVLMLDLPFVMQRVLRYGPASPKRSKKSRGSRR